MIKYKDKYVQTKEIYNEIKSNLSHKGKKMSYTTYFSIIKTFFTILIRELVENLEIVHLPNTMGYLYMDKREHKRAFHIRVDVPKSRETGEKVKYKVPILDDYYYKLCWAGGKGRLHNTKVLPLNIFRKSIKKHLLCQ